MEMPPVGAESFKANKPEKVKEKALPNKHINTLVCGSDRDHHLREARFL